MRASECAEHCSLGGSGFVCPATSSTATPACVSGCIVRRGTRGVPPTPQASTRVGASTARDVPHAAGVHAARRCLRRGLPRAPAFGSDAVARRLCLFDVIPCTPRMWRAQGMLGAKAILAPTRSAVRGLSRQTRKLRFRHVTWHTEVCFGVSRTALGSPMSPKKLLGAAAGRGAPDGAKGP